MNYEKHEYVVHIQQTYKPINVIANNKEEAEYIVQNHYAWGEPMEVLIVAEKKNLNDNA